MKRLLFLLALLVAASAMAISTRADRDLVRFPDAFDRGVHYATVPRGGIRQELYTSRAAIEAARAGVPFPSGTVITLVDYRDDKVFRYVVMEKRTGWGTEYPPDRRAGEWEFQAFNADRSVNAAENVARCFACHQSRREQDFVFTTDRMKQAP